MSDTALGAELPVYTSLMSESVKSSSGPQMLTLWHSFAVAADVAVIVGAVILASLLNLEFGGVPNAVILIVSGALAVISTSAAWLALGPLSLNVRMIGASLVLLAALVGATVPLAATGANAQAVMGMFVAGVAQFSLLQAPYWLFRSWHRLRICQLDEMVGGPIERFQYSLRQMLLVMTLVAVALGVGRGVFWMAANSERALDVDPELIGFFGLLVGYNLLLAWPLIWGVLSPGRIAFRICLGVVLAALVVICTYPMITSLIGREEGSWLYWLLFIPQPLFLLTHLVATRISGYRLVQGM